MERRECETRYELAAAILPSRLRRIAMELPETDKRRAEEFRLRAGHCLSVLLPEGERSLEAIVTTEELETLCDIAAEFSRYASIETLRQGFLPVRGGFRVGLCGSAVVKDGEVTNLKQISSAVIRISREQKGIAQAVAPRLFRDGRFVSTLLLSPPGGGKTTLLRDLVRQLSQGEGVPPQRITLIDEREAVGMWRLPWKMRSEWISSLTTRTWCFRHSSIIRRSSSSVQTMPRGLWGLHSRKMSALRSFSSKSAQSTVHAPSCSTS